ncbi:stage III sporulation protein AF [Ferviditalea candida]|uniref:Stage III sporulation protein AF n=1 Tax=Ferviditalea candida TaxID=3108399 RepID=A0ABU5ZHV6_9BACL|nr:stage III sporulation protein AF [Paenibacillaceae bacterium T2]
MIAWLSGWLKEIIMVILLATFVDLMLPNSSMQRYVKVVISLFILVVLLSPILSALFDRSFSIKAAAELENWSQADAYGKASEAATRYILQQGEKLREEGVKQAADITRERLAGLIRQQIERTEPQRVREVNVKLDIGPNQSLSIGSVQVVLLNDGERDAVKEKSSGSGTGLTISPVKPIEPVDIKIHVGKQKSEAVPAAARTESENASMRETGRRIKRMLTDQWKIPEDKIQIIFDRDPSKPE